MTTAGKVPIVSSHGQFMIFNASDYIRIRRDYRITGNLVGVTAAHTYDSTISGLPAVYSPFEVRLLIEEDVAQLVSSPDDTPDHVQKEYCDYIGEQRLTQGERRGNGALSENDLLYHMPTESPYRESSSLKVNGATAIPATDPTQFSVFRDLWRRNYFITNGNSFGGEFLIYPQDPIVCHASHVVHVMDSPIVLLKDFVTANRLCVAVKKECLFAYLDPNQENAITYRSSDWDSEWNR